MIDILDREILSILQSQGRISNADLARALGKAPSVVLERMRKMEAKGIIKGYEPMLDPKGLGLSLTTFILVRTEESVGNTAAGEKLALFPEVQEVHHTAGHFCYLLKVRVRDTEHLGDLLRRFGAVEKVSDTQTTLVLTTIKETHALPLGRVADTPSSLF
jgi:Lrp/AsnC family transcriptional regulator, leucine-responsive regulatory protein